MLLQWTLTDSWATAFFWRSHVAKQFTHRADIQLHFNSFWVVFLVTWIMWVKYELFGSITGYIFSNRAQVVADIVCVSSGATTQSPRINAVTFLQNYRWVKTSLLFRFNLKCSLVTKLCLWWDLGTICLGIWLGFWKYVWTQTQLEIRRGLVKKRPALEPQTRLEIGQSLPKNIQWCCRFDW